MSHATDQEVFWRGEFGDEYVERNQGATRVAANTALFARILARTRGVHSALELGANIGLNLAALRALLPEASLSAVELNEKAAARLEGSQPEVDLHVGSILEFQPTRTWELVFTKGVLIHIAPERLPQVYDLMARASSRYLMVCEYYNPTPVEVEYRGHAGKLFKRDFAGDLLERVPGLALLDYGFAYRRDPNFPQDDMSWFLLEKAREPGRG